MAIKTFRGKSVNEALAQVKRELGSNAVILHTKTHKVGGVFGIGAQTVTEITATADASVARSVQARSASRNAQSTERRRETADNPEQRQQTTRRELLEYARSAPAAATATAQANPAPPARTRTDRLELDSSDPFAGLSPRRPSREQHRDNRGDRSAEADASGQRADPFRDSPPRTHAKSKATKPPEPLATDPFSKPSVTHPVSASHPMPPAPATPQSNNAIEAELAALRRMVTQVLQTSRVGGAGIHNDALTDVYAKLIENELAAELADEITTEVRQELSRDELASADIVRESILRRLAAYIPVSRSLTPAGPQADGRPLTLALIGPTGVGKTTTIAKLAATYKLRRGKKVGMVTCDTYRIAAVDQLRTYANIIGLPIKVALTPADMRQACQQLSDCDVILIDTAGRSQRDVGKIDELRTLIDAAAPHETHLVLSSTHSERVLAEAAAKFVDIRPDHVIFTKLDEAVSVGLIVNTLRRLNAKLSFVTTGQEVPDQIELGNADRIARLVVDGGSAR